MNVLVLADDESCEQQVRDEPADVVIACGDFHEAVIARIARKVRASRVLAVKGNHDGSGEFPSPIIDLHLRQYTLGGVRFGGFAGSWRYKPRGHHLFDQDEVTRFMAGFPPVDVFIAHNSPRGVHDREDEVHFGFEAFVGYIERAKPWLFIHGHQHVNRETQVGDTIVIGVYGARRLTINPAGP